MPRLKTSLALSLAALVALLAGASAPVAQPADAAPRPAMWAISDADTTVHILGTIHLLKPDVPWFTDDVRRRFEQAESLTLELSPEEMEPAKVQQAMQGLGYYGPEDSLEEHLPAPLYEKLTTIVDEIQLPMQAIDRMKPWLVGVVLVTQYAQRHGYMPQNGVDMVLTNKAKAASIPVLGLETAEVQLHMLAGLPEDEQEVWLRDGIEQIDDIDSYFRRMKDSWLAGDSEALAEQMNEGLKEVPHLAQALLYDRNEKWVPQIESLLDEPGHHFVAVGAGHLVGENSVIDMLREAGHEVTRH